MRFADQLLSYMMTIWGNSRRSGEVQLLHGVDTQKISGVDQPQHFPEIDVWLKSDAWLRDWRKFSTAIAMSMLVCDGKDPKEDPRYLISGIEAFEWMYAQKENIQANVALFETRSREARSYEEGVDACYEWGDFEDTAYNIVTGEDHSAKVIEFEPPDFGWITPLTQESLQSCVDLIDQEVRNFANWYSQTFYTSTNIFKDVESR